MRSVGKLIRKTGKVLHRSMKTGWYRHFYVHSRLRDRAVLLESRNGLDVAGNIFYLMQAMQSGRYGKRKLYLSVCPQVRSRAEALIAQYRLRGVSLVRQGSLRYYRLLAQVRYLFTDTSLPRAYIKKDGQILVNTWHGTPLKKMGKYNLTERHSMGNIQRNLLFSDYLVFPNDYMRETMLESYNIDTSFRGEALCAGYPRNSVFFRPQQAQQLREQLFPKKRRVAVYMPTWKAENMGETLDSSLRALRKTLLEIDALLQDDQLLLVRLHPLVGASADLSGFAHIRPFPKQLEAYEVLAACDVLITDYSSVFFDFACSGKHILLFTPDEREYDAQRGFYFELSQLPFRRVVTPAELTAALELPVSYDAAAFQQRFCTYDGPDSADRILRHVLNGEDTCKVVRCQPSGKRRVLFYCGGLLQNGLTASFKNLLSQIDLQQREYYLAIKQSAFTAHPERLDGLPEQLRLYSMASPLSFTPLEGLALAFYYYLGWETRLIRRLADRAYRRDFCKHFTGLEMQDVIHFSGYDKYILRLFEQWPANRTVFVHSDMEREMTQRHNQHRLTLRRAYRNYDRVAVVTPAMAEVTARISGRRDNIVEVENSINARQIIQNANKPIVFQRETRCSILHPGGIEGILREPGRKFITVGRFSPEKQHFMLIDAFETYWESHPDAYLILIGGPGGLYGKTVAYANAQPCSRHIAVIRSVENPMPILRQCDLFILSSKYEAQPIVIFEADALGVPAICTDMPGPAELLGRFGGTLVQNSKQGILQGIQAFEEGRVRPMGIDFEKYNRQALAQFEDLFNLKEQEQTHEKVFPRHSAV